MKSSNDYLRSGELLSRTNSRVLIVDVQAKLIPLIADHGRVVGNCRRLLEAVGILGIATHATEQYPQGLGPTIPELAALLPEPLEKLRFSAAEVLDWSLDMDGPENVLVAGIEAHVCILQTCFDLLAAGFSVHVPADAVGSRSEADRDTALWRLRDAGVVVTCTESVLFEWCEVSGTEEFRQISKLIRAGAEA